MKILNYVLALGFIMSSAQASLAKATPRLTFNQAGLSHQVLMKVGDTMSDGHTFVKKNDRTAYFPISKDKGILLVGHELHYNPKGLGARYSKLTLEKGKVVKSELWVSGKHNFCSGTKTPWNTLWSGEEFPSGAIIKNWVDKDRIYTETRLAPGDPSAEFGWVYEIDPFAKTKAKRSKRLTALGRLSHEGIAIYDSQTVYMTEDFRDGHLYKFVADSPNNWDKGVIYAYDMAHKSWLPLKDKYNPRLDADLAGATKFNRLEDIRTGPDGTLYIAETGDPKMGDAFGRIWRFDPQTNALEVVVQGDGELMANPDNLVFHPNGDLYIAEDQYHAHLKQFGMNDILRYTTKGKLERVMSVNYGGEPSGMFFAHQGKSMYMSIMAKKQSAVVRIDGF